MSDDIVEKIRKKGEKGLEPLLDYFLKEGLAEKETIEKIKNANKKDIISEHYPYNLKMGRVEYERDKRNLQIELLKLQQWVKRNDQRIVMIFEGRDAAGKGGTIKRFTEHMNPRGARVVALSTPTEQEKGQWYFQRYIQRLPTAGEIVFFDRSWYNRAGVEKVMEFCTDKEYMDFVQQVSSFEKMLIKSGIHVFKFWFSVSREEQLRRFIGRIINPLKRWKISPMDIESLGRWEDYTEAKESMFFFTDTKECPWNVIRSDDKKRARLNTMRFVLSQFEYDGKNHDLVHTADKKIIGAAEKIYEPDELLHREALKRS